MSIVSAFTRASRRYRRDLAPSVAPRQHRPGLLARLLGLIRRRSEFERQLLAAIDRYEEACRDRLELDHATDGWRPANYPAHLRGWYPSEPFIPDNPLLVWMNDREDQTREALVALVEQHGQPTTPWISEIYYEHWWGGPGTHQLKIGNVVVAVLPFEGRPGPLPVVLQF